MCSECHSIDLSVKECDIQLVAESVPADVIIDVILLCDSIVPFIAHFVKKHFEKEFLICVSAGFERLVFFERTVWLRILRQPRILSGKEAVPSVQLKNRFRNVHLTGAVFIVFGVESLLHAVSARIIENAQRMQSSFLIFMKNTSIHIYVTFENCAFRTKTCYKNIL